jgi:hypothetical protein
MEPKKMNNFEEIAVLRTLIDILDKLNIAYAIGGSMASSVYGAVRFTQDADITVEPFSAVADKLYRALKKDFYISKDAMNQAFQNHTSFNVIHSTTAFKIDIFVMADDEFRKQIFSRRKKLLLGKSTEKPLSFVSPEDIVLLKLDWYRKSDCTSERQWSDILGVLSARESEIDIEYLKRWAEKLGIDKLLEKAVLDSRE